MTPDFRQTGASKRGQITDGVAENGRIRHRKEMQTKRALLVPCNMRLSHMSTGQHRPGRTINQRLQNLQQTHGAGFGSGAPALLGAAATENEGFQPPVVHTPTL